MLTNILPKRVREQLTESHCIRCPIMHLKVGIPKDYGIANFFPGRLCLTTNGTGNCTASTWGCVTKDMLDVKITCPKNHKTSMPSCATMMVNVYKEIWKDRYVVLREYSKETCLNISDNTWSV